MSYITNLWTRVQKQFWSKATRFSGDLYNSSMRYFSKYHDVTLTMITYSSWDSVKPELHFFIYQEIKANTSRTRMMTREELSLTKYACYPSELSLINLKNRQTVEGKTCSWKRKLFCSYTLTTHSLLLYACIYIYIYIFLYIFLFFFILNLSFSLVRLTLFWHTHAFYHTRHRHTFVRKYTKLYIRVCMYIYIYII